jgi:hypothetical protein
MVQEIQNNEQKVNIDSLAPVVVFAYNRPMHLELTLEALSHNTLASESVLYVFCDGPKVNATEDQKELIAQTRLVARKKQWCKEVYVTEAVENMGLRKSVISGVSKVMGKHECAIVVEDDLETSPFFLNYMNLCLKKYKDYRGVFSISAQSCINPGRFPNDYPFDVYALQTHFPWGWATWKDRWDLVDWDIDKKMKNILNSQPCMRDAFMRGGQDLYYRSLKERLNGLDVWSICFSLAHFQHHAVSIIPIVSYVHNTGLDGSGANSGNQINSSLSHKYYVNAKETPRLLDVVYEDRRIVNMFYSSAVMQRRPFIKRVINRIGCKLTGKVEFIPKGEVYKV